MRPVRVFLLLCLLGPWAALSRAQQISSYDKGRVEEMLSTVEADVRKHYYDPQLHGLNWDAEVQATKQKIKDSTSLNLAIAHVAALLDKLNDSHTFFIAPPRPYILQFGYYESMIGDRCFITRVRPGSDADQKGVHIGDQVLAINGFTPVRANLWKLHFVLRGLRPQSSLTLDLKTPEGTTKQLVVSAKEIQFPRVESVFKYYIDHIRLAESASQTAPKPLVDLGSGLAIYKYQLFAQTDEQIDDLLKKLKPYQSVVLDLRGNPGGSVETLKRFLGGFFNDSITIADRVTRKGLEDKPMGTKPRDQTYVPAKLVVLIDSQSASAAEIFARTVQLQKRGTIVGDVSSGSVMEAHHFEYKLGMTTMTFYGASITDADLIMTDGKSLEHVGVTPDVVVLPSARDLASGRDPVIAAAVALCGGSITPEKAKSFYPDTWVPD
jgi:carboxyl-terminal processing protease